MSGNSGTGKTTFIVRFILGCSAKFIFAYDHMGQIAERVGVQPIFTFQELQTAVDAHWPLIVFDPSIEFQGMYDAGLDFFADWVFNVSKYLDGVKLFVSDELQKVMDTDNISFELSSVIETGRNFALDCAFVTQAPNLIHNRVKNQITEVVCFQLLDENALKYVAGLGYDVDEVRALPRGTYLAFNGETGAFTKGMVFNARQNKKSIQEKERVTVNSSDQSADQSENTSSVNGNATRKD